MIRRYIDVICFNDKAGNIKPLYFYWGENKRIPIDRVQNVCSRSSLKDGGSGLRFTCVLPNNRIRHLFYDRGKWFVEMNEGMI